LCLTSAIEPEQAEALASSHTQTDMIECAASLPSVFLHDVAQQQRVGRVADRAQHVGAFFAHVIVEFGVATRIIGCVARRPRHPNPVDEPLHVQQTQCRPDHSVLNDGEEHVLVQLPGGHVVDASETGTNRFVLPKDVAERDRRAAQQRRQNAFAIQRRQQPVEQPEDRR
jgi:hypothetical protein